MTDKKDDDLKDKLWEKVLEKLPIDATRLDVNRALKEIILPDDADEGAGGGGVH